MANLKPDIVVRTDQVNLYVSGVVNLKSAQPNLASNREYLLSLFNIGLYLGVAAGSSF